MTPLRQRMIEDEVRLGFLLSVTLKTRFGPWICFDVNRRLAGFTRRRSPRDRRNSLMTGMADLWELDLASVLQTLRN